MLDTIYRGLYRPLSTREANNDNTTLINKPTARYKVESGNSHEHEKREKTRKKITHARPKCWPTKIFRRRNTGPEGKTRTGSGHRSSTSNSMHYSTNLLPITVNFFSSTRIFLIKLLARIVGQISFGSLEILKQAALISQGK